jgi:putative peptide zinc metalloprotease protein
VREIHTSDGKWAAAGEILLVLENDDLALELADLELQIAESELKARQHQQQQELAAYQAETTRSAALRQRCEELGQQLAELSIAAPIAGKVVAPRLDDLAGTFVREGAELLHVASEECKRLQISIAQEDVERFAARCGGPVPVWLPGSSALVGKLQEISPRASVDVPEVAFCASHGGPLAVELDDDSEEGARDYRFLQPRFTGYIELTAEQSVSLHAGQLAIVSFRPLDETLGRKLYNWAAQWIRRRLEQAG